MKITNFNYGIQIEEKNVIIFFGNRFSSRSVLTDLFPYNFSELKQVHGDELVVLNHSKFRNSSELPIADAQTTSTKNLALLIKTADCMPIFIFDDSFEKILAIHAGWRGIANEITTKSINKVFSNSLNLNIVIGPHIKQESFEVDQDVKNQILNTVSPQERPLCYSESSKSGKYLIDLQAVLLLNLRNHFKKINFIITDLSSNTVTNSNLNSYRRDPKNLNRNFSFIVLAG
ncbi:MAG: polyphenol oxidase family protein [Bdellovibrionales bacterium]|nr:polyphenol oxidase family protein [Bdellovibrionales bacterium]